MITSADRSFLTVASSLALALLVAACGAKPKVQATEELVPAREEHPAYKPRELCATLP